MQVFEFVRGRVIERAVSPGRVVEFLELIGSGLVSSILAAGHSTVAPSMTVTTVASLR